MVASAIGAVVGGALGLFGAKKSADAAKSAASTQAAAADRATALQRKMYETSRKDMMPWLDAGKTALAKMMSETGLDDGGGFQTTPGYQFRVDEGQKGVMNSLSALGMKNSGKALKALESFRQGIASEEYGNWLNRVAGLAGAGQTQGNSMAGYGQNAANAMGQGINNAAAARASGYVGAANAWGTGLQQAGSAIGQLSMMRPPNSFAPTADGFRNMIGY